MKEKMKWLVAVITLSTFIQSAAAQPCDLCGTQSFAYGNPREAGDVTAGLHLNYIYSETAMIDGDEVTTPIGVKLATTVIDLSGSYAVTDWLAFHASLPIISRLSKYGFGDTVLESGRDSGLGDAIVSSDFRLLNQQELDTSLLWSIRAGVKLPTGDPDELKRESDNIPADFEGNGGFVHPHDVAFGSGSFDPVFGTSVFAREGHFIFLGDAQYILRTEGDHDYTYGNKTVVSGGPGVFLQVKPERNFRIVANTTFVHADQDEVDGRTVEDSGSIQLFVGPEISFEVTRRFHAVFQYDVPVYLDNDGRQLLPDYQVRAGFTATF